MNPSELEDLIRQSLDDFYRRRMKKLSELELRDVLRKKNPYLFRAIGLEKVSEVADFFINFGTEDGSIDWEKLLRFNSGKEKVSWISRKTLVTSTDDEVDSDYTEEADPTLETDEM